VNNYLILICIFNFKQSRFYSKSHGAVGNACGTPAENRGGKNMRSDALFLKSISEYFISLRGDFIKRKIPNIRVIK
jgi:hypothetical protein